MPLDAKKDSDFGPGTVVFCSDCSIGYLDPLPSTEDLARAYELRAYYTQDQSHFPEVRQTLWDRLLGKLVYAFDRGAPFAPRDIASWLPKSCRAIDIGSGAGIKLSSFADMGFNVFGIEPDPLAVSRTSNDRIKVYPGSAEELPDEVRRMKFDLVSMTHVLEHCRDPGRALDNVCSILKPGGIFWCEVPNSSCHHFRTFNVCSEMFDAPRHLYFLDLQSITGLLAAHGLQVFHVYYHGYARHHSPAWRAWERDIASRMRSKHPNIAVAKHTLLRSLGLAIRTLLAPPAAKYDCVGVLARPISGV